MARGIQAGDKAPDFTLPSQAGEPVRLADRLAEHSVVLYFYPRDETRGCSAEACAFRDSYEVFAEAGELSVFIDEEQLQIIERQMSEKGYLDGAQMGSAFSMIRANDPIWSFVVNNYLLGKDPLPFDVLFWGSDATRMPRKMHSFYLRNM